MSDPAAAHSSSTEERLGVMERRWAREREARLESERIAEAGLRELWTLTSELDRRVEERTSELQLEYERAEAAVVAKTRFLANLSHEVRTPLHAIVSVLELVEPVAEGDLERLDLARSAAGAVLDLFENLLELSQIESGSTELSAHPTDLQDVADELVAHWNPRLRDLGLLLVPESAGSAVVDPVRLRQIGDALLDNAAKFAAVGTVRFRLTRAEHEVVMEVSDDGPGVQPEHLDAIFTPFVQIDDSASRLVQGTGVGLSVVRGLARHMGGSATAGPSDTGGLAVTVVLPCPHGASAASEGTP